MNLNEVGLRWLSVETKEYKKRQKAVVLYVQKWWRQVRRRR